MKKINLIAALIVAILILTACTEQVELNEETSKLTNDLITFTPMEFGASEVMTRGTQTTKNTITEYGVSAAIYPATNTFSTAACGSYWFNQTIIAATGESGHYWPGNDYRLAFYAYAPTNTATLYPTNKNKTGYPEYTYTVPSAIANQADFITANVTNISGEARTEPVELAFSHQCADICFNIYNQGSDNITVHSIAINGVKYSGTFCEGNNPKWTLNNSVNSTSVNPFLLSLGTVIAAEATVDVTGTTNHFIMLPQTVASGTSIFDVDATVSGIRKHYYHTLTTDLTLQPAKCYTFNLTLGEGAMIVDEETDIQDWQVEMKYLEVKPVGANNTWTQPAVTDGQDINIENWQEE